MVQLPQKWTRGSSSSATKTWFSNRVSPSHIPPTRIKSSWKSISQSTLQPFGGIKVSMNCFLEPNGMISGISNACGRYTSNEFIEIRDQLTSMQWCEDCEMKSGTQILTCSYDFAMSFQPKWMKSSVPKVKRFLPTLTLKSLHLHANARYAHLDSFELLSTFKLPFNLQAADLPNRCYLTPPRSCNSVVECR